MIDPITEEILQETDPVAVGIMTIAAVIAMLTVLLRNIKDAEREQIKRSCKKYKGKEKKQCGYKIRIKMMKKYLSKIPGYKAKCGKTKDPEKCRIYLKKAEDKVKAKIKKLESKLT